MKPDAKHIERFLTETLPIHFRLDARDYPVICLTRLVPQSEDARHLHGKIREECRFVLPISCGRIINNGSVSAHVPRVNCKSEKEAIRVRRVLQRIEMRSTFLVLRSMPRV